MFHVVCPFTITGHLRLPLRLMVVVGASICPAMRTTDNLAGMSIRSHWEISKSRLWMIRQVPEIAIYIVAIHQDAGLPDSVQLLLAASADLHLTWNCQIPGDQPAGMLRTGRLPAEAESGVWVGNFANFRQI